MAFKMNYKNSPFPFKSGIGGVQAEDDLKKEMKEGPNIKDQKTIGEGGLLESEHPDTDVTADPGIKKGWDTDDLQERIEFIKETATDQQRALTKKERADIEALRNQAKTQGLKDK